MDNEQRLEQFADFVEAFSDIFSDKEIVDVVRGGGKKIKAVTMAIKNHKQACVRLLAAMDGESPETYKVPDPVTLTIKLVNFLNREEIQDLFTSQAPKNIAVFSGSATENTGDGVN